jgi:hypothetical protein
MNKKRHSHYLGNLKNFRSYMLGTHSGTKTLSLSIYLFIYHLDKYLYRYIELSIYTYTNIHIAECKLH